MTRSNDCQAIAYPGQVTWKHFNVLAKITIGIQELIISPRGTAKYAESSFKIVHTKI